MKITTAAQHVGPRLVDAATERPAPSIGRLVYAGAAWTIFGLGSSQLLRLISVLVLTRFLAPEHFGLMALINALMIGLTMFSDLGIGANIIQSRRGDDADFLNSAWTLQVLRGCLIWICCAIGAWPLVEFYGEPQLLLLAPTCALACVISGFNSTKIYTANRTLALGALTAIELCAQAAALVAMIGLAQIHPSVWVLVAGSLIGAFVKMLASHLLLAGPINRFRWESRSLHTLVKFGRWIFLSSIFSFAVDSAGSLILGKFVSMAEIGVFAIGVSLAKVVEQAYEQLGQRVVFPAYAKIRDLPLEQIRNRVRRIRIGMMIALVPPLLVLVVFGDEIVRVLFDSRYQDAGWVLQVFAAGLIPKIVTATGPFYLALGNSRLLMQLSAIRLLSFVMAVCVGWWVARTDGMICGMAMYTVLVYFAEVWVQRSYSIWLPRVDLAAYLFSGMVILTGLWT